MKKAPILSKYDASVKMCFECFRVVYNATRQCPSCGYVFYIRKVKK